MTLPASGAISTADIRTEIGGSGAVTIPSTETRALTGVASGPIVLPDDFWGKSSFSASASPTTRTASGAFGDGAITGNTTATPAGGSGSYTYTWSRVSGSTAIVPTEHLLATTAFVIGPQVGPAVVNTVFKCTVTDAVSAATADTNTVSVTITLT